MGIYLAEFEYQFEGFEGLGRSQFTRLIKADNLKIAINKANEWWETREKGDVHENGVDQTYNSLQKRTLLSVVVTEPIK